MHAFRDPGSGLEIDSCPECYGLWFDSEELRSFFESADLSARILEEEASVGLVQPAAAATPVGVRGCPTCDDSLFESRLGQVQVDYCLGCRGIWLDRNELEGLVREFQAGTRGNLLIVNQLVEGLGTSTRPNPKAQDFLQALDHYRSSLDRELRGRIRET